jgi:hypothetical protein
MVDNNGEPVAARKLPLKKRVVTILEAEEDDDGDKKPAARSSPESVAVFDACSSPEARDQLEQALECIPDEEKAAYLEAVETAHQVIEDESNPVWFIRFEQCNFWAAARRLVTYWKERKALFGDRAFRPLKLLTGAGALNEADITVLRFCWLAMLPNDNEGRSVLYFDRSRILSHENNELIFESKCRVSFFWLSILSENIASQSDGFVFIIRICSKIAGHVYLRGAKTFFHLIRNAMPTRIKTAHATCCPPKGGRNTFLKIILPAAIQQHGKFCDNIIVVHTGASEHDICGKLQAHCMNPEGVPEVLGGMWKFEALLQWMFTENPDWTKYCPDEASMDLPLDFPMEAAGENALAASECNGSTNSIKNNAEICDNDGNEYSDGNEYPALAAQACYELEEALELIPDEEKAAYMEAMQRVPDLVDSETDHFRFLWYEKYNISAAARRLVSYWECRKELFGERAFLPMTQMENGALSQDDITVFETGYLVLLPDDTDGCAVVCYDGSRLGPSVHDPGGRSRLRCLFYTLSVVSEKRRACVDGFVGIEIASELGYEQSKGRFFELAEKVLPVHLKALHLVNSPPTTVVEKTFFGTIVPATLKLLGATAYRRAHVHTGKSKEEILEKLKACGFFSKGLPECVGGTWTYDNLSKWQTERRPVEEEIHLIADVYEQKSQKPTSLGPIPKKPAGASSIDAASAEEGKQINPRKRSVNSIYSRTKRERQKVKLHLIQDESTRLTLRNAELRRDNDYLERLLATVEAAIARKEHLVPRTIPVSGAQPQAHLGLSTSRGGVYAQQPVAGLSMSQGMTCEQQTPLGLPSSGVPCAQNQLPGGVYAQQPVTVLSISRGMTYEQQTPLGLPSSGVPYAQNQTGEVYAHQPVTGLSMSQGRTYEQQTPLGLPSSGVPYAQNQLPGPLSFGNIGAVLGPQMILQEQQFLEKPSLGSLLLGQDFIANRAALRAHQMRQQHGQLQLSEVVAPQATMIHPGTFYPVGLSSGGGANRRSLALSDPPVGYAAQEAASQACPPDQHQNHDRRRWLQQQFQNLPGAPPSFGQPHPP